MSIFSIKAPASFRVTIHLPASKSISNRTLLLNALSSNPCSVENLSESDDTYLLSKALRSEESSFDIGAAGTSMRFLTAYLSQKQGEWTITGTERMKNRPIKVLVDALRQLGAHIEYLEKENFPPLKIVGKRLEGGSVCLDGGVSSQYISALMMIAPCLKKGVEIKLTGNVISIPYIFMTRSLMKSFGVDVQWENNSIKIEPQSYRAISFKIESDWSAASYWYEIMALSDTDPEIELVGLDRESSQGDSFGRDLFHELGVETFFTEKGISLKKKPVANWEGLLHYDFTNMPDLAQTFVVTCCLKNIPFRFTGLQTLKIKETDRILALRNEMKKLGYLLSDESDNTLIWDGSRCDPDTDPVISTYEDHRMAMAFAPVCLKRDRIRIQDPSVVTKSYPGYWKDLDSAGFKIIETI